MGRILTIIVSLAVLIGGLYFCIDYIKTLEKDITEARVKIKQLDAIAAESVRRLDKMATVTLQLENKESARQEEYRVFSRSLNELACENEAVRAALSTVIPSGALRGLRSFGQSSNSSDSPHKSSGAPACSNIDTNR